MTRYVFVDDETPDRIQPLCDALSDPKLDLKVESKAPAVFEAELKQLRAIADGLILDHRLDEKPGSDGQRVSYRGFTLAQEIRNRATDKTEWEGWTYPLVLLSFQAKLTASYDPDVTSHDLFDAVFAKEAATDDPERVRRHLVGLARGYEELRGIRTRALADTARVQAVLGKNAPLDRLDPRITFRLVTVNPCHADAQFVIRDLLDRPGALVAEPMIAARLGIDPRSEGWNTILEAVRAARYEGIFHDVHARWWWQRIDEWWRSLSKGQPSLASQTADERVEAISKATREMRLKPAQPSTGESETRFWTVCVDTGVFLDPVDAVRIAEAEPKPWQDPNYVSLAVAIAGSFKTDVKVHPLEVRRVKAAQEAAASDV
jgi:hypothetical protein